MSKTGRLNPFSDRHKNPFRMTTLTPSRRTFLLASLGLVTLNTSQVVSRFGLTTGQVIDRIKANVGIPWREQTVDNLVAGTPDLAVNGIAVAMMATLD